MNAPTHAPTPLMLGSFRPQKFSWGNLMLDLQPAVQLASGETT